MRRSAHPSNFSHFKYIHEIFEQQASAVPGNTALVYKGNYLSYKKLNEASNQLAHYLICQKNNAIIGIYLERSSETLISILAVLKSGAAYLPIDPTNPKERIQTILEDSGVSLIISNSQFVAELPNLKINSLCLDQIHHQLNQLSTENPEASVNIHTLAYIIYTSGSTGKPKGVMVKHHNVVRLFTETQRWFQFNEQDVWTLFHSCAFDFSVWEIWGALFYGGSLVIVPHPVTRSPVDFYQLVQKEKVSILNLTPSALQQFILADALSEEKKLSLRYIILGGEALNFQILRPWYKCHSDDSPQIINMYGITETTVHVTYYPVKLKDLEQQHRIIGTPISDLKAYVLNGNMLPVKDQEIGELFIGGAGVTNGYLNNPALTKQNFIVNPAIAPDQTLYKTGDLVSYKKDGNLIYMGRADFQIQIRGFRVEPAEIESVLLSHPLIQQTVVVSQSNMQRGNRLVAYIITAGNHKLSNDDLLKFMKGKLPDYMVPAEYVFLQTLPLTSNGKTDRKNLPLPKGNRNLNRAYIPPENDIQKKISEIWCDVLRITGIGIEDNFFHLGGNSLNSFQIILRINEQIGSSLSPAALFEYPSIRELSYHLDDSALSGKSNTIYPTNDLIAPLSFSQENIWLIHQQEEKNALYNITKYLEIKGSLNIEALKQSLAQIIEKHEIFRTKFIATEGLPAQVIIEDSSLAFEISSADSEKTKHYLIDQAARRCFNLSSGILYHFLLLEGNNDEFTLVYTMHHIIMDGWSYSLFHQDLAFNYNSIVAKKGSSHLKLPVQYKDYALWQRKYLNEKKLKDHLTYWEKKLYNASTILKLPTDFSRPDTLSFAADTYTHPISIELSDQLTDLGKQHGVSLFITLLTVFKCLLYRYTHQEDFLVGTPVAGRNHRLAEKLIGYFVNTVVIRSAFYPEQTFSNLLKNVKKSCLEAFSHQDLPFSQLVKHFHSERNLNHQPLFQVMFVLQMDEVQQMQMEKLEVQVKNVPNVLAKFDLTLSVTKTTHGITADFEYNKDLFKRDTIKNMAIHFNNILEKVLADPEIKISNIDFLSREETTVLLDKWNNIRFEYAENKCIYHFFEAQVSKTPNNIALQFNDSSLTYEELNKKANQLAHYLIQCKVVPETKVGICMHRSIEMIISVLAIWKSGGAYVAIDPEIPHERKKFFVKDAEVSILLINDASIQKRDFDTAIIDVNEQRETILKMTDSNPAIIISMRNLAYIIYTSGSTGMPKGILIEHKGLPNLILQHIPKLNVQPGDVILLFASLNFDASLWDICLSLCSGATLYIANKTSLLPGPELTCLINENSITHATLPPSALSLLSPDQFPDLKVITVTGEACSKKLVALWSEKIKLFNGYGPSEVTIGATISDDDASSIGKPMANYQVYLLDDYLQLVPRGVQGELYIGGIGLARGYLNNPELTREKFIKNPFDKTGNSKLYKTGDIARHLPDGTLEFTGRKDNMIKLRGMRIEPGEIEAALTAHAGVKMAAVIAKEIVVGNTQLIAYLQSEETEKPQSIQLRKFLQEKLPAYMIPAKFIILEKLPLNSNGKINRNILHELKINNHEATPLYQPQTKIEITTAKIWRETLSVNSIGIFDNFFEIGGHSLLASLLISRINERFKTSISVRVVFEFPTIFDLSKKIRQVIKENKEILPPIVPQTDKKVRASFAQERLWTLEKIVGSNGQYNMSLTYKITGKLDVKTLERSICKLVDRQKILQTSFTFKNNQLFIKAAHKIAAVEIIDLQEKEENYRKLVNERAQQPFDLSHGPYFRPVIILLADNSFLLQFTIHHNIFDGFSADILFKELFAIYEALKGKEINIPPLKIQYTDYSEWQRENWSDQYLSPYIDYWKNHLEGANLYLNLPTDRPRPPIKSNRGDDYFFEIDKNLKDKLETLSRKLDTTAYLVLLTAFKILLYRYSNQNDILIGTPVSNRTHADLHHLIGIFINTLVIRTKFNGTHSFQDLLEQVKLTFFKALENQELPFERLVEVVNPPRNLSISPVMQVLFEMHTTAPWPRHINELKIESLNAQPGTSQYDITLSIENSGDQWRCGIEFNTDIFDKSTIERFSVHYLTLLEDIVSSTDKKIDNLLIIPSQERTLLLESWNSTPVQALPDSSIHQQFELQAIKRPDHVAVVFKEEKLSYKKLNDIANKVSHQLISSNVRPGQMIGICVDPSLEMIITLLAILKAGCSYVPLDPKFPQERLNYMIADSHIQRLICKSLDRDNFIGFKGNINTIENILTDSADQPIYNVAFAPKTDQVAYTIYTSGSTGLPKGVVISHRSVNNLFHSIKCSIGLKEADTFLLVTSVSFDISVLEIFLPLVFGGKLVIPPPGITSDGALFSNFLHSEKIKFAQATPTQWELLIRSGWEKQAPLNILSGGEALSLTLAKQLLKRGKSLWNMYGPTETTIWSAINKIDHTTDRITIGKPISNTLFYLLDHHLQLVPIGVPGELYIGGEGLALGYLNQKEITRSKFIDNPFSQKPSKIYRTGDLFKYLADGTLEFLGRSDDQIKINGYRIELGEIEYWIHKIPSIKKVKVLVSYSSPEVKELVAYLIFEKCDKLDSKALRKNLMENLPSYMIPSKFIVVENFPLTPNQKIDNKALLKLPMDGLEGKLNPLIEDEKPYSPLQLKLKRIWKSILGLPAVGMDENFFDLGGNSLLAVKLFTLLKKELSVSMPVSSLFNNPTISGIARLIETGDYNHQWSSLVPIRTKGNKEPIFLIHGAGGNVLLYKELSELLDADRPVYGLQSQGLDDKSTILTTIEEMASQYVKEMRIIQPSGPYYLGGYCMGGTLAFEIARIINEENQEVAFLGLFETYNLWKSKPPSLLKSLYFKAENMLFHSKNYHLLSKKNKKRFLNFKLQTEKIRWKTHIQNLKKYKWYQQRDNGCSTIENINDVAQAKYLPQYYNGEIHLFRPEKYFTGLNDDQFGWENLAKKVSIHRLPFYPKAMLVSPFVKILAKNINNITSEGKLKKS